MNLSASSYPLTEYIWKNTIYCLTYCLATVAQMPVGQIFLRFLDHILWITEKSSQWSLPYNELIPEINGKSLKALELIRPVPWLIFLPILLILRSFRFIWNIGAAIIGYPIIEPSDVVKNLQKARRHLRAIKISGIKSIRQKRNVKSRPLEKSLHVARGSLLKSIQSTLSSLSCLDSSKFSPSPPPKLIQIRLNNQMSLTPDEKSATESTITSSLRVGDLKRRYTEITSEEQESDESENETLNEKIDRLAQENSSDDPDFDHNVSTSETSSTSNETDVEEEEEEEKEEEEEALEKEENVLQNEIPLPAENIHTEATSRINTENSTCGDANGKNREILKYPEEQHDYHSPPEYKSGDDAEAEFYSPVSSKSASPERVVSDFSEDQKSQVEWKRHELMTKETGGVIVDTEISGKSNGHTETSPSQQVSNRHTCAPKIQAKSHQRKGKRVIHGNRKKK